MMFARVPCLFVEYYPDLDLAPRGRLLYLSVTATPISARIEQDDIVVRNPVAEPDDRFLVQARDSVAARRVYLARRHGLSRKKRYRFDFAVDSTGARFTGDSLGVAFAVGAIAAVSKIEVFRERISISPDAAFSGALSAEGKLASIDTDALKLKIYRAFHSGLKFLVIPREHLTDAWKYLSELEAEYPERKLELMGADTLEAVIADPRFLPTERSSRPAYIARKAWRAKRAMWVEVPALLFLAYLLASLVYRPVWIFFDSNPARLEITERGIVAKNKDGQSIAGYFSFPDGLDEAYIKQKLLPGGESYYYVIQDIDGDSRAEVIFCAVPRAATANADQGPVYVFDISRLSRTLHLRFQLPIFVRSGYRGDNEMPRSLAWSYALRGLATVADSATNSRTIITVSATSEPGRSQVLAYDVSGRLKGVYLNQGNFVSDCVKCTDIDGNGHAELLLGGVNNRLNSACLAILDPDSLSGVSPPWNQEYFLESGMPKGSQLYYLTFPKSELTDPENALNLAQSVNFSRGQLFIAIDEMRDRPDLYYHFDAHIRPLQVSPGDGFEAAFATVTGHAPSPQMYDSLLHRVGVWRDTVQVLP